MSGRATDPRPLSQAPRVCRAGADPGGPPPALCAGLQPRGAHVEAGVQAAGLVCEPRAQVRGCRVGGGCAHIRSRVAGPGRVVVSGPPVPPPKPLI